MSVFTSDVTVEGGNPVAVKVDGSAVVQPISGTVTANLGTVDGLALDATLTSGAQKTQVTNFPATQPVSGTVTVTQATGTNLHTVVDNFPADADALAQGSSTPGQLGALVMGAATTAAPAYTTATTNPLSLDTAGNLRVTGSITSNTGSTATITQVSVTNASSITLLAANANRKKAIIDVPTIGTSILIGFVATTTATQFTYRFTTNNTILEVTNYTGVISALSTGATNLVNVTEIV